jgi:hypothetical protein
MTRRFTLTTVAGSLSIVAFLALALASYARYPSAFNPRDNWLSDLGNSLLNPSGSVLYRVAAVLTGVLLALFFVGIGSLAQGQQTRVKVFLLLGRLFGMISALAVVMTGIFSEGQHSSHSLWSAVLYICFGTAAFFIGWALLYVRGFPRGLSYFAFVITVFDWVMSVFNQTHFLEWVMVALMLLFVGIVSYLSTGSHRLETSLRSRV